MINNKFFLWAFIFSFNWINICNALTLEDAIISGLQNSRELASSQQAWVAARESVFSSEGSSEFGLSYAGSGSFSRTNSGSGFKSSDTYSNKITLSKDIYDFGRVGANTTLSEIKLDLAYFSHKNTEQSVILATAKAYLGVIKARRELRLNENNLGRIAAHVSAAELRILEGTDTPTALAEVNARYSRAKADKILSLASLENAADLFQKLTEINANEMMEIGELPVLVQNLPSSIVEAANDAQKNNLNVKSAVASERAAAQTIVTTQTAQKPSVSLSFSGIQGETSDSLSASLSFSASLYDTKSVEASLRKTVADHSRARIDLEEARAVAKLEARSAYRDWQAATTSLKAVKSEILASRLAAEGVKSEVEFGLKTSLDMLDAEKNVSDAKLRLVSAEHDKLLAGLTLSASVGALMTENLGLENIIEDLESLQRPKKPVESGYDDFQNQTLGAGFLSYVENNNEIMMRSNPTVKTSRLNDRVSWKFPKK